MLHKKKNRPGCYDYRGTLVVSHALTVRLKIDADRLSDYSEAGRILPHEQCGLHPARSTAIVLFVYL